MNEWTTPQNDVALRILKATDELMAREGMHNISTHKIAKAAKVSVGTIYLYFKDKETLLNQLVVFLFNTYQQYMQQVYRPDLPLFEQYKILWHSSFQFMQENPNVIINYHQYESLPSYRMIMRHCLDDNLVWNRFIREGQVQGVIVNLDSKLLFAMTMKVSWEIMQLQSILDRRYAEEEIEEIMLRTWKAITF